MYEEENDQPKGLGKKDGRRSSGILKIKRSCLTELDATQVQERSDVFVNGKRISRRVSFAERCSIKEFPKHSPRVWQDSPDTKNDNADDTVELTEDDVGHISGLDQLLKGPIQTLSANDSMSYGLQVPDHLSVLNNTRLDVEDMDMTACCGDMSVRHDNHNTSILATYQQPAPPPENKITALSFLSHLASGMDVSSNAVPEPRRRGAGLMFDADDDFGEITAGFTGIIGAALAEQNENQNNHGLVIPTNEREASMEMTDVLPTNIIPGQNSNPALVIPTIQLASDSDANMELTEVLPQNPTLEKRQSLADITSTVRFSQSEPGANMELTDVLTKNLMLDKRQSLTDVTRRFSSGVSANMELTCVDGIADLTNHSDKENIQISMGLINPVSVPPASTFVPPISDDKENKHLLFDVNSKLDLSLFLNKDEEEDDEVSFKDKTAEISAGLKTNKKLIESQMNVMPQVSLTRDAESVINSQSKSSFDNSTCVTNPLVHLEVHDKSLYTKAEEKFNQLHKPAAQSAGLCFGTSAMDLDLDFNVTMNTTDAKSPNASQSKDSQLRTSIVMAEKPIAKEAVPKIEKCVVDKRPSARLPSLSTVSHADFSGIDILDVDTQNDVFLSQDRKPEENVANETEKTETNPNITRSTFDLVRKENPSLKRRLQSLDATQAEAKARIKQHRTDSLSKSQTSTHENTGENMEVNEQEEKMATVEPAQVEKCVEMTSDGQQLNRDTSSVKSVSPSTDLDIDDEPMPEAMLKTDVTVTTTLSHDVKNGDRVDHQSTNNTSDVNTSNTVSVTRTSTSNNSSISHGSSNSSLSFSMSKSMCGPWTFDIFCEKMSINYIEAARRSSLVIREKVNLEVLQEVLAAKVIKVPECEILDSMIETVEQRNKQENDKLEELNAEVSKCEPQLFALVRDAPQRGELHKEIVGLSQACRRLAKKQWKSLRCETEKTFHQRLKVESVELEKAVSEILDHTTDMAQQCTDVDRVHMDIDKEIARLQAQPKADLTEREKIEKRQHDLKKVMEEKKIKLAEVESVKMKKEEELSEIQKDLQKLEQRNHHDHNKLVDHHAQVKQLKLNLQHQEILHYWCILEENYTTSQATFLFLQDTIQFIVDYKITDNQHQIRGIKIQSLLQGNKFIHNV
ncbi:uncharacterized protein LOC126821015 [Patella vulgata]|uniref:uncharacterized protein LOC126821015 n=1 Tax=Patella vulgata TaxID=6465 RepID=UPI0024A98841|nr:uncharacterized protein LOC126821015 [Patella vulgata]